MQEGQAHSDYRDDEITLKQVIESVADYLREIWSNIIFIGLIALFGGIIGGVLWYLTPDQYEAEYTFMINEDQGGSMLGLGSILGQIGLGSAGDVKLDKIMELARSREICADVLFRKENIDGKGDYLGNHFISSLENEGEWGASSLIYGPSDLKGFRFAHDSIPVFELLEKKALKTGQKKLNYALTTLIDEVTGVMTFKVVTTSEVLSANLCSALFEEVTEYYRDKTVEKQLSTFNTLQYKCDSIYGLLNKKEFELANFKDTYRNQWLNTENVTTSRLRREINMLTLMYGEAIKNREVAEFSLQNQTPFMQPIDEPMMPLKRLKAPIWLQVLRYLIFGAVIGVVYVALKKLYRDIVNS